MLYYLVSVLAFLYFLHYFIHYTRKGVLFNKVPGPKMWPVIGNGIDLIQDSIPLFYRGRMMANLVRNRGNICRLWFFNRPILNIFEPDDIEVLLSNIKFIKKGYAYRFLYEWLKEGLLTSTGEKWQHRRKILTPTFHFNILKQFCKTFVEQSNNLVKQLEIEVGKDETVIQPYIQFFTLHSISETAMGTNLESTRSNVAKYKQAIFRTGEMVVHRFARLWLHPHFLYYKMSAYGKEETKMVSIMHDFTTSVIRERRSAKHDFDDNMNFDDNEVLGMKKKMAMLDLLLKAEKEGQIKEDGIREEVDTFMFEGHDTLTMAITFCLMLLANNPDAQDKIVAELNEIFENPNVEPTMEDFNKMTYMELCIKESLRLYPSVPFITRELAEDMHLKNYVIPAGTECYLHIFDVHRNPNLYPNPDKFDPERFLPENTRKRHPYAYIPFSAGPRNCIGQRFALYEEKAVLSAILRNYKLEPVTRPNDIIFTADIILRSVTPIKIKILKRTT